MNRLDEQNEHSQLVRNIVDFASYLPFMGLCSIVFFAISQLINQKQFSLSLVIYVFIPSGGYCLLYVIISIYMRNKYGIHVPIINKKVLILFIIMSALLISVFVSVIFCNNHKEIPQVGLNELTDIKSSQKYFIVFRTENYTSCIKMKDIYASAFTSNSKVNMYYVDLTFESLDNILVKDMGITVLPTLVCYQNGKEVDRIEGIVKLEIVENFLRQ